MLAERLLPNQYFRFGGHPARAARVPKNIGEADIAGAIWERT